MIPPLAPPFYDDSLSLFENLSHFYCWYRQQSQGQPRDTFYRLLQIAKRSKLSKELTSEVSVALNDLSDALRSSSIQISSVGDSLDKIESKILQINPKAILIATITSLELRTQDKPSISKNRTLILALLQRITPDSLNDFQAKLIARHLNTYLNAPSSIKPLVEISVLLKHWFKSPQTS